MRIFFRLVMVALILLVAHHALLSPAQASDKTQDEKSDLEEVRLTLADLPPDFTPRSSGDGLGFEQLARYFTSQIGRENLAGLRNIAIFRSDEEAEPHVIASGLLAQLTENEQTRLNNIFSQDSSGLLDYIGGQILEQDFEQSENAARFHIKSVRQCGTTKCIEEYLTILRGTVLLMINYTYPESESPLVEIHQVAYLLDRRLTSSQAISERPYRPKINLVPMISTYIPTPLEVSLDPVLLLINLILAIVLFLLFLITANTFSDLLVDITEDSEVFKRIHALMSSSPKFLETALINTLRNQEKINQTFKLLLIFLFYGLIYSLLEPGWKPFTNEGVFFFVTMLIGSGLVGLSDDIMRWRKFVDWKIPSSLRPHLTNILVSIGSVGISRILILRPGLMFGSPKILQYDEEDIRDDQKNKLVQLSLLLGLGIILITWIPTIFTSGFLQTNVSTQSRNLWIAAEAFLLIIFAVELENLFLFFVELSLQEFQKKPRFIRWQYHLGLIGITFAFFHVLTNPQGDLFQAVQTGSMFRWMCVVVGFVVFVLYVLIKRKWSQSLSVQSQQILKRIVFVAGVITVAVTGVVDFFAHKPVSTQEPSDALTIREITPEFTATQQSWQTERALFDAESQVSDTLLPDWKLVRFESFENDQLNWEETGGVAANGSKLFKLENGILNFSTEAIYGESLIFAGLPLEPVKDFYLAFDIRQVSGPGDSEGGIIFHMEDADIFYYLGINSNGHFWLEKNNKGIWEDILTNEEIRNYQPCRWNRIAMLSSETKIQLFLNGTKGPIFKKEAPHSGAFGLVAWFARPDERSTWQIDNLELRVPP